MSRPLRSLAQASALHLYRYLTEGNRSQARLWRSVIATSLFAVLMLVSAARALWTDPPGHCVSAVHRLYAPGSRFALPCCNYPASGLPQVNANSDTTAGEWSLVKATRFPRSTKKEVSHMATGTVKFFNTQKGYGFIEPSDGSKDVFVHISAVERAGMSTLTEGQKISYDVVTERGKTNAANLQEA